MHRWSFVAMLDWAVEHLVGVLLVAYGAAAAVVVWLLS